MSVLHVEGWTTEQVADWIAGLDESLALYANNFVSRNVDGSKLLNLMAGDLIAYGVDKVGDQVLLAEAIQNLRNELESDRVTLQTLASSVAVRSKTYRSELTCSRAKKNFISNESLASASYLLDAGKALVRWLTRFPFLGVEEYDEITKLMTKHLFELAMLSQRDVFADNAIEDAQYLCTKIIELCDEIIGSKDSLTIQPAAVDVITIRKRHEQELGLKFDSSFFGIHVVSGVNLSSPAHQSGHLERGDEILQVNYQTVVGWAHAAVENLLYENPCEVILTLKRRPRHASNSLGHMYLRPSKLPGRSSKSKLVVAAQFPIMEVEDDEDEDEPDEKLKNIPVEMPQNAEPSAANSSAAETRFRKLYPKPRNLLRRRATVTGASPTSTRPPVTFTNDESMQATTSSSSSTTSRHKLDKCVSAPERNKLEKQSQVDEALRLFVGDLNVRGSRVTLPCIGTSAAPLPDLINPKPGVSSLEPPSVNSDVSVAKAKGGADKSEDESSDDVFESSENSTVKDARQLSRTQDPEPELCCAKVDTNITLPQLQEPTFESPDKSVDNGQHSVPAVPVQSETVKFNENLQSEKVPDGQVTPEANVTQPPVAKPRSISPTKVLQAKPVPLLLEKKHSSPLLITASSSAREELRKTWPTKPQSLTNLTTAVNDEPRPLYSGFLHQRQPHWKFGGPRWSRCRASVDSKVFRLLKPELTISIDAAVVTLASEVHSRPFAFKIEDKRDKAMVHYFAAESQPELNIWLEYLGAADQVIERSRGPGMLNRSMSVQPEPIRGVSPLPSDRQRRLSLPHTQLQNQLRRKLHKQHSTSAALSNSTNTLMEDKLRFWNSSPSPTHKSNISSITITSCKRTQQMEIAKKKYFENGNRGGSRQSSLEQSDLPLPRDRNGTTDSSKPSTPVKKPLDSPSKKCKMGVSMLLRRKGSDTTNNNDVCGACGRSYATVSTSTQTDELVLVFSGIGVENESRI